MAAQSSDVSIKDGVIDDDDVEELSEKLGRSWKKLARRLGFKKAEITGFHKENEEYAEKAMTMLETWKENYGSEATYRVMYDALCHKNVKRKGLAEEICCHVSEENGTVPMKLRIKEVTQTKAESTQSKADLKRVIREMAICFIDTTFDDIPPEEWPRSLRYYLEGVLAVKTKRASVGCLRITLECGSLEILERLWDDYCSGHLNKVAQERLLTDDIKRRFRVESVKLTTTILQQDYLACKLFLKERNQDSTANTDESFAAGSQTQAVGETRRQSAKSDPMTLPSAINYSPKPKRKSSPAISKEAQEGVPPPKRKPKFSSGGRSIQLPEQSTPTTVHAKGQPSSS